MINQNKKSYSKILLSLIFTFSLTTSHNRLVAEGSFLDTLKQGAMAAGMAALSALLQQLATNPELAKTIPIPTLLSVAKAAGAPIPEELAGPMDLSGAAGLASGLVGSALNKIGVPSSVTDAVKSTAQAAATGDTSGAIATVTTAAAGEVTEQLDNIGVPSEVVDVAKAAAEGDTSAIQDAVTEAATENLEGLGVPTDVTDLASTVAQGDTDGLTEAATGLVSTAVQQGTGLAVQKATGTIEQVKQIPELAQGQLDGVQEAVINSIGDGTDAVTDLQDDLESQGESSLDDLIDEGGTIADAGADTLNSGSDALSDGLDQISDTFADSNDALADAVE